MRSRIVCFYAHFLFFSLQCLTVGLVSAGTPISRVSVSLRGQKYDVSEVTTVQELQEKVSTLSGISVKQQGRVIFGGKRLPTDTVLSDVGIEDGAQINIVPSTSGSKKKKAATTPLPSAESTASSNVLNDVLKNSGMDTKGLDEMMKQFGGAGPKSMEEGMKAMQEAMNSPLLQEMLNDPEKLEQSRQMILNNPMLKSMMSQMPGMDDLLNDKDAWRQAMQMAAELYKSMDSDTLMKAMMGGAEAASQNMMGGMPGMMDGSTLMNDSTTAATLALDELDED
jgi:Ubiquitin family